MDLQGSLVDTNLRIYPTKKLVDYIKTIAADDIPSNILKLANKKILENVSTEISGKKVNKCVHINDADTEFLKRIEGVINVKDDVLEDTELDQSNNKLEEKTEKKKVNEIEDRKKDGGDNKDRDYLNTSDVTWLYHYLNQERTKNDDVPYLHVLMEGAHVEVPENAIIKRNPLLEARCVKLRAQQEAREYRKMTKSVDNVRMRFPEDSISYQLKQLNRQLIAIGQFIISIFAGFLFGFRGVEWMVGNLDFGFRLLLGVMCALVIALAEIYFLAKKLNEELCIPETVQLGGPPKFADESLNPYVPKEQKAIDKEHQD